MYRLFSLFVLSFVLQQSVIAEEPVPLKIDGQTFAEYKYIGVPFKPYIATLRTPAGRNVLRDAPHDHLHHHALMFALAVNGCNFWEEYGKPGKEITTAFKAEPASLQTELDWATPESKTVLKEKRRISVAKKPEVVLLDWQSALSAPDSETVHLDKSNHHYFGLGIRFDQTMDKGGRFFNDTGKQDGDIVRGDERLTPCRWTAYTAKLQDKPVTVAVFGHPKNPVPTMAFTMGDAGKSFAYLGITLNLHRKPVDVEPGKVLTFNYRVAVWEGEVSAETVEKEYQNYE
ncbi:MAG: PmoA family protein [Planctomycetaceae bacterium]|jgi:hypothetical protein|nr:PmoA family protein [Planctomycetaceae bacterium]